MLPLFKKNSGFTIVELIVVITIIAILSGGAALSITANAKQARDTRRKADLQQIKSALEFYRSNNTEGYYPSDPNNCCGEPTRRYVYNSSGRKYALVETGYLEEMPVDPTSTSTDIIDYVYNALPEGCNNAVSGTIIYCTSYTLTATEMETQDPYVVTPTSID